ncbi:dCTP deaminase [Ancylobacter mangrovi]|uniref:dCTP deaminase n=1 Tax=Ancylobacter mangrovi TaxID=2972472 RepID=A0A9X2P8G9_9HYPH|nr:dCTP deaminase [Ancylobacter mangrovi]MCS0494202.1 dCTP deaminase [Ancylobacter mangrovi]MCS0501071.1 dCTP deaminase [Ancylobacter mangrovi]
MILTDRDILDALKDGTLAIEPAPPPEFYAPNGVDLRLDSRLTLYRAPGAEEDPVIDPAGPGYSFREAIGAMADDIEIGTGGFVLDPGRLVLGWTLERVDLTAGARLAARVEGKSSLARIGLLVHLTAPTIHAGSTGRIQLEIINLGPRPIRLRAGMKVCQLILEQTLGVPQRAYGGQFAGQRAAG